MTFTLQEVVSGDNTENRHETLEAAQAAAPDGVVWYRETETQWAGYLDARQFGIEAT